MDKEIYEMLAANGAMSAADVATALGYDEAEVAAALANPDMFAFDEVTGTYSAQPDYIPVDADTKFAVDNLSELFQQADNPDELAAFLVTNGISNALVADGEYVVKQLRTELGELAEKFAVADPNGQIAKVNANLTALQGLLHAIRLTNKAVA